MSIPVYSCMQYVNVHGVNTRNSSYVQKCTHVLQLCVKHCKTISSIHLEATLEQRTARKHENAAGLRALSQFVPYFFEQLLDPPSLGCHVGNEVCSPKAPNANYSALRSRLQCTTNQPFTRQSCESKSAI